MRDAKNLKKPEPKYLVRHDGPNRAARRKMQSILVVRRKRFNTWWRSLERAGIDPRRVLLARQIRESLLAKAAKQAESDVEEEVLDGTVG